MRFITAMVIARSIGPERYGTYVLAMIVIAIVEVFGLLGLEPAMIKFVAQYKASGEFERVRSVLRFGLGASFASTLAISLCVFFFSDGIAGSMFHNKELGPVLRIMVLGAPFTSMMVIILAALQGARLVKYKIFVQQVFSPVFRFAAILAAFGMGFQLMGIACVWTLTATAGLCLASGLVIKKMGQPLSWKKESSPKEILSFSLPLMISRAFNQNISIAGILIIGMFCSSSDVGVYGVAMRTIPFLLVPFIAFNGILSPLFSELFTKKKMDELESVYKIGNKWVILITLPMCILMIHYSDFIVSVFGSGFSRSAQVMSVILVGHMVNAASGSAGLILSMTGRPMFILFNTGALFGLNIGLTIFLLGRMGIVGAAYAYSTSVIIIQCLQLAEVWFLYGIHPFCLENFKAIIASAISFGILYIFNYFIFWPDVYQSFAGGGIFVGSYAVCLLILGFSREDRLILDRFKARIGNMRDRTENMQG